jgi:hypothetical protein
VRQQSIHQHRAIDSPGWGLADSSGVDVGEDSPKLLARRVSDFSTVAPWQRDWSGQVGPQTYPSKNAIEPTGAVLQKFADITKIHQEGPHC